MNKRHYSAIDRLLIQFENGLTTLCAPKPSRRPNPAAQIPEPALSETERRQSAAMMRVNHAGEICAQALYFGQMAMAKSTGVQQALNKAAEEEVDHLDWTRQRLAELNSHPSYLNFFWYSQSYILGLLAGLRGDRWSLGFIEETERQVAHHLQGHLARLPASDHKSRAIVAQMRKDEQLHGQNAAQAGARHLPSIVKWIMAMQAKVMTTIAAWV